MSIIVAVVTVAMVTACTSEPSPDAPPRTSVAVTPAAEAPPPETHAVGIRQLRLARNKHRPLRTILLYPAAGAGREGDPVQADAAPAVGKFPLVIYSHGLHGTPERYVPAAAGWASAGFMVALPAFPYTSAEAKDYREKDIKNQPADASYVIRKIRDLGRTAGDPLQGRIDADHVAAVGHSAGGYTTSGMFTKGHDPRLKAGVVLAGWPAPGAYGGPPATMLFVHGDSDPVVPVANSWAAYDKVPWQKAFVLLPKNHHAAYMLPGNKGFPEVESLIVDFLRWTLNGDETAHGRFAVMVRNSPGDPGTMGG